MTSGPPYGDAAHQRVVVVGGGIAGLSIARALRTETPAADVIVLERADRPGGHLRSERIEGYLCEAGPDGFLDNAPATLALAHDLGLAARVLPSRDEARRRFIFRGGRLHEVPLSPWAFATSGLLSPGSKLRVACEPLARPAPRRDESIGQFAERHIGREAARVLVGSMVSGIFAGDAEELSLGACFPRMREMDERYGSLVRAMIAKRRERRNSNGLGAPAGRLTSFVDGMEEFARAAAASLGPAVRTGQNVTGLLVRPHRNALTGPRPIGARAFGLTSGGAGIEADAVVLAGPARDTAGLLRTFAPVAADLLAGLPTAPLAVVCLGYDEAAVRAARGPLDGFGFLVPRGEGPRILGALWESSIYEHRAPAGRVLLRVMIGGASDPAAVDLSDSAMVSVVRQDLARTMGLALAPSFQHVVRHRRGIPQYTIGHEARLARVEQLLAGHPGLFLAGNSYRGIAVNACVADAPRVAALVRGHLRTAERATGYALAR